MNALEQTERAIQTFYHCEDEHERNSAHQWLLELQKSSDGWGISWMLLDIQKVVEVQYYGAVILHFKISHNIKEIDENNINEMRIKLLQLLISFSNGPKLVISKLCCVYSAFILQTLQEDFELLHYVNEIENGVKVLSPEPKFLMLDFLTILPTEFKTLELGSNQKIICRKFLNDFRSMIMVLCKNVLQVESSDQTEIKHQNDMLSCLFCWIEFGISIADASDIIPLLFSKIPVEHFTDKICEVLIELVTSPKNYRTESTILNFLHESLQLEPLIDEAIVKENDDLLNNLCLLFVNLGETHCRTFLKATDNQHQMAVLNFVKIILKFTSLKGNYPVDETCSELTLNFWYTLQDDLYSIDIDEVTDYQKQFCEAYVMLLDVFHRKVQYPPGDVFSNYTPDEKEIFRCYRIDIQDTMLYVYTLLEERCLVYICQKLEKLLADPSSQWQEFESALHLLRGASESIDTSESVYLPKILSLLPSIPKHPQNYDSLFLFLGGLSEWLNAHPNEIVNILPFLLQGILNPDTSTSCSIALKDICHECSMLLDHSAALSILQTCYTGLRAQSTSLKVVVRFFEIGGYVISALPVDMMKEQLDLLVSPLFHWLKSTVQQVDVTVISKKKIIHYLNCFYGIFRALDPFEELQVHPVVTVYGQLISLFRMLKPWCNFEEIADGVSNCITKALEVAREKLIEHVLTTSEVLADFFLMQPFGCILDASSILIGMFGSEGEVNERIRNLFALLTDACLRMVETGVSKDHPDVMQSFMDLLTRTIKTVPEFLYGDTTQQQVIILRCALNLLMYQETPTIKSTCNFLVTFVNLSGSYENSQHVIENVGRDIIIQSVLCISGASPRHTTDHFADVILAFSKNYVTLLAIWLNDIFSNDGFPTVNASSRHKEHFQTAILREKSNKRRMKEMIREFSLVCRGLHGMSYVQ